MNLDRLIQDTAKELSPSRDLWPDIEQRLQPTATARQDRFWPMAACLLLGILLGGQFMPFAPRAPQAGPDNPLLIQLRQFHLQRVNQLEPRPELMTVSTQADLTVLRAGTEELYQALLQQPDDPALLELLLWAQQREWELLHAGPVNPHLQSL